MSGHENVYGWTYGQTDGQTMGGRQAHRYIPQTFQSGDKKIYTPDIPGGYNKGFSITFQKSFLLNTPDSLMLFVCPIKETKYQGQRFFFSFFLIWFLYTRSAFPSMYLQNTVMQQKRTFPAKLFLSWKERFLYLFF